MRITSSTMSIDRRCTGRRIGRAALLTTASRWPKASQASTASRAAASGSDRSAVHMRWPAPSVRPLSAEASRQASSTPDSRSVRRAAIPTVAPLLANIGANAAPMPDDAPVTRILAPSSVGNALMATVLHRPEAIRSAGELSRQSGPGAGPHCLESLGPVPIASALPSVVRGERI